ncbi:hypothetical protein NMY22_g7048 [Coprinellus aureogranulatus]|nr:hypothetical protein NMY22_g7048 [Coprinellus aureogranulatus]
MKPTGKLSLRDNFFGQGSVEVTPPPPGAKEGGIRRLAVTADKLLTQPSPDVNTIPDVLDHAVEHYPHKNAVGWRDVVRIVEEKKVIKKVVNGVEKEEEKTWKYFELSDPKYLTFPDYRTAVREVARALVSLGIRKDDDVINIYAQTSPNWQLISQACALISTPIATSYETLGEEGLTHSLNEPNCRAVFTNADLLPMLLKVLPNTPSIEFVFYDGEPKASLLDQIDAVPREGGGKIKYYHIDALRQTGQEVTDETLTQRRPSPETNACIMYTSGSTGKPKGVQLTHGNLIASLASVNFLYGHHLPEDTVYLAYLPLAHVFEYIVELTLTDQSVRNCKGDLTVFQPTVMLGVPAVWEQIRKGITGKLEDMGWVAKTVVETAMTTKRLGLPVVSWLMDKYVLSGVRKPTGGNLRWAINGGAAISKDTQEYLSLAVMPLMQGYGMTESCGMCAILPPELHQYNSVGLPVPSLEVKLLDCPDMGYTSSNNPPQGEICVRGPSVTKGYYKRPDLNEDETIFTKDGWFRTGDVGQWNEDGTLSIIDRLKNLIKLQSGEYIALEKLESIYKSCDLVANICVYASQDAVQPIAIVVPHESKLRAAVSSNPSTSSVSTAPFPDLCANKEVQKLVTNACNDTGKKNKFKGAELLKGVVLTAEEWTPENGLVTAAQKVNRGVIGKKFKDQIEEVYSH